MTNNKNIPDVIKDSGDRTEFSTGAVRDLQGEDKGRCDLVPLGVAAMLFIHNSKVEDILLFINEFMETGDINYLRDSILAFCKMRGWTAPECILEVSIHYRQGSEKYQPYNWQKGIPLSLFISSAVRHLMKNVDNHTDERHDRAFIWNIMGAIWTVEHRKNMVDIPFELLQAGGVENEKV